MEVAAFAAAEASEACVRGWGRLEYSGMSFVELSWWTGTWWLILEKKQNVYFIQFSHSSFAKEI